MAQVPSFAIESNARFGAYTIHVSSVFAFRVYSDTRPRNSYISSLQKGLILVYNGAETIGEGTGFGVPVLIYSDEAYFSGSSNVYLFEQDDSKVIRKEFFMDRVPRERLGRIRLGNQGIARLLSRALKVLAEFYRHHKHLQFLTIAHAIDVILGVHTDFLKTSPVGKVVVTYRISQNHICVEMDLSLMRRERLNKILVLNELGSRFFRGYSDSNGKKLVDGKVRPWEKVEAEWASIISMQNRVGFRLCQRKDSILLRGREYLKGYRDWIGLEYEVNPELDHFEYEIEVWGA